MEDLRSWDKNLKSLEQQANLLENLIALHNRRSTIIPELEALKDHSEETKKNVERFKEIIEHELSLTMERYHKLQDRIHQQQIRMLTIMAMANKKPISLSVPGSVPQQKQLLKQTNCKSLSKGKSPLRPIDIPRNNVHSSIKITTPQGFSLDYYDGITPCKSNNPCRSLNYYDFELPDVTQEMFDKVPKYMKGRISLDELIDFLDNIVISCFNEKYQLLQKKREYVKNKELAIWNAFKAQGFLFPNQKFITQGDISRKCNKLIDKKISDKLTMLRHLRFLQEKRKDSVICYIWMA